MIPDSTGRNVQTIQRTFDIVNTLQMYGKITLDKLAKKLDMPKSTLHNYLSTLESLGYVVKQNGSYRLGLRYLNHGMAARNILQTQIPLTGVLNSISEQVSESIWWIIEELGRAVFILKSDSVENNETYAQVGKRSYLHTHAPGKAILAHHSNEYVDKVISKHGLPSYTSKTIDSKQNLLNELNEIRGKGYSISEGEAVQGVKSVGITFEDQHQFVHSIGVFRNIHNEDIEYPPEKLAAELQNGVDKIEEIIEDMEE